MPFLFSLQPGVLGSFLGFDLITCQLACSLQSEPGQYLLLDQLKLLRLQKLLGHALWVFLAAQTQRPKLFAESGCVLVQEPCELDLKGLDVWLIIPNATC